MRRPYHHLDLEIAVHHQLLQPRVLRLQLLQPAHLIGRQGAELLAPVVDRLLANLVSLRDNTGWLPIVRPEIAIRFLSGLTPQDRHHLFVRKTGLPHDNHLSRWSRPKQELVRKT